MRLKIVCSCKQNLIVPFNYNHCLCSAISRATHASALVPNRNFSLYTFSQLFFDQYCVGAEGIKNLGKFVCWYISSPKVFFLEAVLKGLKIAGCISLAGYSLPIEGIEILATPVFGSTIEFSCMSPITVTSSLADDGRPRYGRLEDSDFGDKLRQELINKYYHVYDALPANDDLQFYFNQRYIKDKRRVSRLIEFNGIKILAYMIPFKVSGNPELIRLGYQLGFGSKNNFGFGMVKIWHPVNSLAEDEVACETSNGY